LNQSSGRGQNVSLLVLIRRTRWTGPTFFRITTAHQANYCSAALLPIRSAKIGTEDLKGLRFSKRRARLEEEFSSLPEGI